MSNPSITPLYNVFSHKLNSAWNSRHIPQCFSTDSKRWTFLLCKKCRTGNRSNPHIHRSRAEHLQAKFLTLPKRLWLPPVVVWRRRSRRRKSSYRRTSHCSNYIIRYRASFPTPNILWIYWFTQLLDCIIYLDWSLMSMRLHCCTTRVRIRTIHCSLTVCPNMPYRCHLLILENCGESLFDTDF